VREQSNDSAEKRERRERRVSGRSGYQFAEGDWQCPKEGYVDMR
jgi:hypothetical protein